MSPAHALVAFRSLLSLIFLYSGFSHLLRPEAVAGRLVAAPFGHLATLAAPAEALVVLTGVVLLGGGVALLAGYRTRLAATLLIAVLIPITLTVQVGPETLGPLFKNVAILGGLLYFATHGAPVHSVDARRLAELERELRSQNLLERAPDGTLRLTPKALRQLGETALRGVLDRAREQGQRDNSSAGAAGELIGSTRPWRFGDTEPWNVPRTVTNAVLRSAGGPVELDVVDVEVSETEQRSRAAVALCVDTSWSMVQDGRWVPMKRTALALHHLVRTRFRTDALELITFGRHAETVDIGQLTALESGQREAGFLGVGDGDAAVESVTAGEQLQIERARVCQVVQHRSDGNAPRLRRVPLRKGGSSSFVFFLFCIFKAGKSTN